ncbi:hypothetical protein D3C72_1773970 [compost metagenome]
MRIDRHGWLAKCYVQHHIGRLAAYARQGLQRFAGIGNLATMELHQHAAGFHQVLGLAAVQANGLDMALQAFEAQVQNGLRRVGNRKELARGLVHAHIGGLGRQQHGGEQLEHRGVLQLGLRRRVGGLQRGKKRFDIGGFHGGNLF